jgi:hypothetical protein
VFGSSPPADYNSQFTESGGFGPNIPTKQRMPNPRGGSAPAAKFFHLTREEESPEHFEDCRETLLAVLQGVGVGSADVQIHPLHSEHPD